MITYDTGGTYFFWNLFRVYGSVFPQALLVSIPNAVVSAGFVLFIHDWNMFKGYDPEWVMNNNAIWGGFSFLVGFLVVFRTSQAYHRFWEGCTQTHKMGAEWFDSCSSLMAFCKHSDAERSEILRFQNLLIRLFSMLHAAALGEIEDCGIHHNYIEVQAFSMELIDAESVDSESLVAIRDCDAKVELIFQWIQQLVVENIKTGVLSIPAPILSRSFQEIATGMVHFHEAMKISNVPFPFPYAQTCDCLLMFHWILVPFVSSQWVPKAWWAATFAFIQVFTFWTLNLIAVELENPFGTDPNDIDGAHMQLEMNNHLRLLIRPEAMKTPKLAKVAAQKLDKLTMKAYMGDEYVPQRSGSVATNSTHSALWSAREQSEPLSTFHKIWQSMDAAQQAVRRYSRITRGKSRDPMTSRRLGSTGSMALSMQRQTLGSSSMPTSSMATSPLAQGSGSKLGLGSGFLPEFTESSQDNSQGLPETLNQAPMEDAQDVKGMKDLALPVRHDDVMTNSQDLLQQGIWEPFLDGDNGARRYQTPSNVRASPYSLPPTIYSRENLENYQGSFANDENALQMRLGEIFDQLDTSGYEGPWEDTLEDPGRQFVAIPTAMPMNRPPSAPSNWRKNWSSLEGDAIQVPAAESLRLGATPTFH